jgi:hypothetical protein
MRTPASPLAPTFPWRLIQSAQPVQGARSSQHETMALCFAAASIPEYLLSINGRVMCFCTQG